MQQIKHEIHAPWKSHFQAIQGEIQNLGQQILLLKGTIYDKKQKPPKSGSKELTSWSQEVLALKGMIYDKEQEQSSLRKHASYIVGQLIEEAKLPPAMDAYQLSPDGAYLLASVADEPKG